MDNYELKILNRKTIVEYDAMLTEMTVGVSSSKYDSHYSGLNKGDEMDSNISYITDISNSRFFHLNQSLSQLTGFDNYYIKQKGTAFLNSLIYKDDVVRVCAINTWFYNYIIALPVNERTTATSVIQYRIVTAAGKCITIMLYLQVYELDVNGNPASVTGTYRNHTGFKSDNIVSGTVFNRDETASIDYSAYHTEPNIYTPHEIEVLLLIPTCTTKQITEQMNIAESSFYGYCRTIVNKHYATLNPKPAGKVSIKTIAQEWNVLNKPKN